MDKKVLQHEYRHFGALKSLWQISSGYPEPSWIHRLDLLVVLFGSTSWKRGNRNCDIQSIKENCCIRKSLLPKRFLVWSSLPFVQLLRPVERIGLSLVMFDSYLSDLLLVLYLVRINNRLTAQSGNSRVLFLMLTIAESSIIPWGKHLLRSWGGFADTKVFLQPSNGCKWQHGRGPSNGCKWQHGRGYLRVEMGLRMTPLEHESYLLGRVN